MEDWITAKDIYLSLRVRSELLVGALCHSGRLELEAGDEVMGLLRAFLFAGCRSVLLYPWVLVDDSAGMFMSAFYEAAVSRGSDGVAYFAQAKDKAVQAAQVDMIRRGQQGDRPASDYPTYEHPYYWAWTLIGDYA